MTKKSERHSSSNIIVIGIDHGWSLIKTSDFIFTTGVKELTTQPAFPNHVLPYYAEDTLTLKLQELRERYAKTVAPPEQYLVTAEQLDAFVRQTVEQIVSVWQKKENQFS